MLATSRASESDTASCSASGQTDFGMRLFGRTQNSTAGPDGAVATFYEACKRHHVRKPKTGLIEALLGTEADSRQAHLLAVRTLDFSFDYFGARHLMVLADFVQTVEGPVFAQQRLRFSLTPYLQELVLRDLQLDFDVPTNQHANLNSCTRTSLPVSVDVNANDAIRYLFKSLEAHPSLQRLDVSENAIGPALLPALQRLVKRTPSLVEVVLVNCALSLDEQMVVEAMCHLNQLRRDQKGAVDAHERLDDEWQRQQDTWLRRQLRSGEPCVPAVLATPQSPYIGSVNGRPVLRYRLPKEDQSLLSQDCLDVIRSAFVEPSVAVLTTLQGRAVPRGVPPPLAWPPCRMDDGTRTALIDQVCDSALFRCLRQHVFHPPTAPPSRYAHLGPTFRSTKEDHYAHIIAMQLKQWRVIVGRLVDLMTPSTFSAGDTLFRTGEDSFWLTFLPRPSGTNDAAAFVEVTPVSDVDPAASQASSPRTKALPTPLSTTYRIQAGQFVGEDDLLSAPPHYVSDKYDVAVAPSTARTSTAVIRQSSAPTDAALGAPSSVPCAEITVWQIPRDVALFFLSAPFHTMHKRSARVLKMFPALRTTSPALLARVAYALQPVGITAVELRDAQSGAGDGKDPRRQANAQALAAHIYILEEGEFYLGHGTSKGRWSEKSLEGGVVVMNATAIELDGAIRRDAAGLAALLGPVATTGRTARGEKLGKEAFERQFREAQRLHHQQENPSSPEHVACVSPPAPGSPGPGTAAHTDAALSLGGTSSHWKYYVVSNEDFASLPQCVRLALTRTYVSVND